MRHPILRLFQLACTLALAVLGYVGSLQAARRPTGTEFTLTALGETEHCSENSWRGSDLLEPDNRHAERVQLTFRPSEDVRVTVESVGPEGVQRLFPAFAEDEIFEANKAYALPSPSAFYEVVGEAKLRLKVTPVRAPFLEEAPAEYLGESRMVVYPLSDGGEHPVSEKKFRAAGAGVLELAIQGK